jgi:DNA-binding GntR family transcriptional regulator
VAHLVHIDLDRRRIPQQLADELVRLVLSGELSPGQPLPEREIARDLGVSHNTMRETVRLLEHSGLVRYEVNRGAIVREPSPRAVQDLYQARLAIETGAAWVAGSRRCGFTIHASAAWLDTALADGDAQSIITADADFHRRIVAAAQSVRLNDAFTAVLNERHLYLNAISVPDAVELLEASICEHEAVAAAADAGSREQLLELVASHIRQEATRLLEILANLAGVSD